MSFLGFELIAGNLPQSNAEVLVSETYLSIHKLVLGDTFSFEYVDTLIKELKENTLIRPTVQQAFFNLQHPNCLDC
jgi:putative ABC transport system permease protein